MPCGASHGEGLLSFVRTAAPADGERLELPMLSFVREFWAFLVARKKLWMLPILIVMAVFGGALVLTKGSAIAPFIYAIF